MSKKFDPQAPSGRIAFDTRGNAIWQWRTDTGEFKSDVDTHTVKAIQDSTGVKLSEAPVPSIDMPNHDPYSTADTPRSQRFPRRTLDDMRRLSEEIKRAREQKRTP